MTDLTGRISGTVTIGTGSQLDSSHECFGVSSPLPSNLHNWSSHCTGLLFAGKLPDLHSRVPTYDNQPQSGLVWSLKGTFFHLLISSGVLVVPKNVSSSVRKRKPSSVWKPFRRVIELVCRCQLGCSRGIFCFFWIHKMFESITKCPSIFLLFTLVLLIVHSWFLIRCFV